jgi:hypothetical protein
VSANLEALVQVLSLGAALSVSDRQDSENISTRIPHYELSVQAYSALPSPRFHLRSGLRWGWDGAPEDSGQNSPEMRETSQRATMETGILFDGPLIPTLILQAFVVTRSLELDTKRNATVLPANSERKEWLQGGAAHLGIGIPLDRGRFLIEPFYRFLFIPGDSRQTSQWGAELSWAFWETQQN